MPWSFPLSTCPLWFQGKALNFTTTALFLGIFLEKVPRAYLKEHNLERTQVCSQADLSLDLSSVISQSHQQDKDLSLFPICKGNVCSRSLLCRVAKRAKDSMVNRLGYHRCLRDLLVFVVGALGAGAGMVECLAPGSNNNALATAQHSGP